MSNEPARLEMLVQLVLRARFSSALMETGDDWLALGAIASRMLFWCGGAIYGFRCEGNEMRFAIQVAHSSIGAMAHHISGAYALHLRKTRALKGKAFKHYVARILEDDTYLDELVRWLHRPGAESGSTTRLWTAESAYLNPNSIPWISTSRILSSLSIGAPDAATYLRRRSEALTPSAIDSFTRRAERAPRKGDHSIEIEDDPIVAPPRPSIEEIGHIVADYCKVSYKNMLTDARRRPESKARVITTVLATRNGATAAAAARLFNRSRSTLIEQVEYYRARQPELFAQAEEALEAVLRNRENSLAGENAADVSAET